MSLLQHPIKVAIVDDDVTIVKLYKKILETMNGLDLYTFTSAPEALKVMVEEKNFAIAIIDINMPDLPGEIMVEKLVQKNLGVDVIVATGSESALRTLPCILNGAREILGKPIMKKELTEAVQRSVDRVERLRAYFRELHQ